ncbi:hypothetical protein [Halobacillus sp. Marseille-P3879]|uniref:hypothetical protein n=1 Tax=Halobacillus sp. Marseille-P3879 TaxID=2045014 RepID=UPI000C7D7F25|nr:hypothetical protein [Halobacillus sp. Marseille-P3879]
MKLKDHKIVEIITNGGTIKRGTQETEEDVETGTTAENESDKDLAFVYKAVCKHLENVCNCYLCTNQGRSKYNEKEVTEMCVSNHTFEIQAYRMFEKIKACSIYSPVGLIYMGNETVDLTVEAPETIKLIDKIVLRGRDGTLYEVEPSENGLKFAQGELTYEEYVEEKKTTNRKVITYLSLITSAFFATGWAFIELFV